MKNAKSILLSLMVMLAGVVNFALEAQQKNDVQNTVKTSLGPHGIVRTIKQDSNRTIWITSWEGVFKYDNRLQDGLGDTFTNIMTTVSSARFFSVLEDRKGNFWFASIGSGVYYCDGKALAAGRAHFQNFTTKDGLANDRVTNIYEDKAGRVWFGTENGASVYDGSLPVGQVAFRNLKMREIPNVAATDSVQVSVKQGPSPEPIWMHNDVNAIVEDDSGKFWFGTRGSASIYDARLPDGDAKTFTTIIHNGKPFTNVRCIIKDRNGNMWLGGSDGLWRFDGATFTNFTKRFVGYIYEDRKGNIWTSSERDNPTIWVLSRYDGTTLSNKMPAVTEIVTKPMIFGILEDDQGNIWFGGLDGVYRYDGRTVSDFKGK